ncbi:MAG: biotin/lipoate--protein ligase family protein [Rhodomicrobiaceae bacterium]
MRDRLPTFPPLLTGHQLASGVPPADWAVARASEAKLGAGDLGWSEDRDNLRLALVLEPEVARPRCPEIVYAAMVATGDAIGALSPPELAITYRWPSIILANEAEVGFVDLVIAENEEHGIPAWMVLSIHLRLRPGRNSPEPGRDPGQTSLWDEGCGDLGRSELLESVSRHIVNLIHGWSEDGFKPIHEQWWGRLSVTAALALGASDDHEGDTLLGLDESGNALLKTASGAKALMTTDALERLRKQRGSGS